MINLESINYNFDHINLSKDLNRKKIKHYLISWFNRNPFLIFQMIFYLIFFLDNFKNNIF